MNYETGLIPRQCLPDMAAQYQQSLKDMRSGLELVKKAQDALKLAFGTGSRVSYAFEIRDPYRHTTWEMKPEEVETQWRQQAWRILVDRMELKRVCSVAKANEIEKQLEDAKTLPEITEQNMVAMIEGAASNISGFLEEAAVEVFEALRPWRDSDVNGHYKTNEVFQIGERVCLEHYCELGYSGGKFRLSYYTDRTQRIRCIDNIMHMLDGKGPVPTHAGPLVDALNGPENMGRVETEYFEAKCYKKGSLHLRFKRLDLLARLNAIGANGAPQLRS